MNKFPYIAESNQSKVPWLIYSKSLAICLGNELHSYKKINNYDAVEFFSKNITAEYLTNTYGKVESKEHAEFIVKLAEGAGFYINEYKESNKWFCFSKSNLFFLDKKSAASDNKERPISLPMPPKEENMSNLDLIPNKLDSKHENWDNYYVSKGSWLWQRVEQLNSRTGCMSYDTPEKGIIRDIWNQLNTDIKTNKENTNLQKTGFKVGELVVWDGNKKVYGRIKSISGGIATITACQILDKAEYKKDLCSLKRYAATAENQPKGSKEWPVAGDSFIHKGELVKCISKGIMSNGDEVITFEFSDGLSHGSCWNNESWVKKPPTPEDELDRKLYDFFQCNCEEDLAEAIINGEIEGLEYKPQ